ncbi:hypothetical protein [Gabonibacter massiliensis]|uniref:hypothetical protein n=1 Tax=Gabonibacter massiliensis TaxID=1720195 RepID=UPI00073E990B|nr:hypothetical protein [Gabonibacter massiliensis]
MKKWCLLFVVTLCCTMAEVKAQAKDTTSQKKIKTIVKEISREEKWASYVYFRDKGKLTKVEGTVIQKGTPLTVEVAWNPQVVKTIVFDTAVYKPTTQEIKNCKYTFVIKPERTTTYKYKFYYQNGQERVVSRKITVTDKNGIEIKIKNNPKEKE